MLCAIPRGGALQVLKWQDWTFPKCLTRISIHVGGSHLVVSLFGYQRH